MEEYSDHEQLIWMKRKEMSKAWEERAFAEDTARIVGGCIWPPRSYTCTFCKREFRSAQALGGHMNVHRRDRARLKQTPPQSSASQNVFSCPINHSDDLKGLSCHHHVETDLSVGLNYSMFPQKLPSGDDVGIISCKRPKITCISNSLPVLLNPFSNDRLLAFHSPEIVLGLKPAAMDDLDLELRLGTPQKV